MMHNNGIDSIPVFCVDFFDGGYEQAAKRIANIRFDLDEAAKRDICLLPGEKNRDKGGSRYSRHLAFGDQSMREKKEMEGVTWLTKR